MIIFINLLKNLIKNSVGIFLFVWLLISSIIFGILLIEKFPNFSYSRIVKFIFIFVSFFLSFYWVKHLWKAIEIVNESEKITKPLLRLFAISTIPQIILTFCIILIDSKPLITLNNLLGASTISGSFSGLIMTIIQLLPDGFKSRFISTTQSNPKNIKSSQSRIMKLQEKKSIGHEGMLSIEDSKTSNGQLSVAEEEGKMSIKNQ